MRIKQLQTLKQMRMIRNRIDHAFRNCCCSTGRQVLETRTAACYVRCPYMCVQSPTAHVTSRIPAAVVRFFGVRRGLLERRVLQADALNSRNWPVMAAGGIVRVGFVRRSRVVRPHSLGIGEIDN